MQRRGSTAGHLAVEALGVADRSHWNGIGCDGMAFSPISWSIRPSTSFGGEACFHIVKVTFIQGNDQQAARSVWMRYSRWLVAGLTFQLAADIIETSVAPSWDDIGQLGAIAVIRTFLDFFLARDQREVRGLEEDSQTRAAP